MLSRWSVLHFIKLAFPKLILVVLGLTAFAYILIDLFPIQSVGPFQNMQARVAVSLWQTFVWAAYSISISFLIYYFLGFKQGLTQSSLSCFMSQNFGEYITAQLRILIRVSLWFLAFIIPGVVMDARLRLTSLFIFFHPRFHEDRTIDPLQLSLKAIPLKKMGLISLLILLVFLGPLFIDTFYAHAHLMFEPRGRIVQILLYSFLNLWIHCYLFKTYLDLTEEKYV